MARIEAHLHACEHRAAAKFMQRTVMPRRRACMPGLSSLLKARGLPLAVGPCRGARCGPKRCGGRQACSAAVGVAVAVGHLVADVLPWHSQGPWLSGIPPSLLTGN